MASWQASLLIQEAKSRLQNRELNEALNITKKMLQLESDCPNIQIMAGVVFEALNRPNEAAAHYQNAITLNPYLPKPYIRLLRMNQGLGTPHGDLLMAGIQHCPNNRYLLNSLENFQETSSCQKMNLALQF